MKFKRISFENVFCYGNGVQTIKFDDNAELWQIVGKNGVGKSSFIKMLKVACYRELDGVKVSEIANDINKRGFIEVEFSSRGHEWVIKSSFSPNKLEIYKDGSSKPEDWGSIDDTASKIRTEVLDTPYYIFNNTISLSINDFKSFLKMKPVDARNIRDRIFGFAIINDMAELLKGNVSKYNALGSEVESKLETISESIVTSEEKYASLEEQIKNDNQGKLDDLVNERENISTKYEAEKKILDGKEAQMIEAELTINFISNELKKNTVTDIEERVGNAKSRYEQVKSEKNKLLEQKDNLSSEKNRLKLVGVYNKLIEYRDVLEKSKSLYNDVLSSMDTKKTVLDAVAAEVDELSRKTLVRESCQKLLIKKQLVAEKKSKLEVVNKEHDELSNKLKEFGDKKIIGDQKIKESENNIKQYEAKVDLYNKGVCPECETDLTSGEHSDRKELYQADLEKEKKRLESLKETMTKLVNTIAKLKENMEFVFSESALITADISKAEHEISNLIGIYQIPNDILDKNVDELSEWIESIDVSDEVMKSKSEEADALEKEYTDMQSEVSKLKQDIDKKEAEVSAYESQVGDEPVSVDGLKFDSEEAYTEEINKCIELYKAAEDNANKGYEDLKDLETKLQNLKDSIVPDSNFVDVRFDIADKESFISEAGNKIETMRSEMAIIGEEIVKRKSDLQEIENSMTRLDVQIKEYSTGDAFKNQLESIKEIIDKFKADKEEKEKELDKYEKALTYYKVIQQILSDEGIKAYILKDIIPAINNEISSILAMLGVPITVIFDEEFKVHLYRFGREINLKTISTGQTKMVDCAILLAMTKIIKQKYSDTNVIFYDEVFSSIDSDYRVMLLEIFKEICCNQLGLHTFMVNHSYMPSNYFGYIVPIVSEDGFSHINVMTPDEYEAREVLTIG